MSTMTTDHDFQCSAIHEAAHVVSAMHWGVPIGRRGVSLRAGRHGGAAGFSHLHWNAMPKTKPMTHAYRINMLIAPFAEFQFLVNMGLASTGDGQSPAALRGLLRIVEQSRGDFGAIIGLERTKLLDSRRRENKAAMLYGTVCFAFRAQREPDTWVQSVSSETVIMTRVLVRDTDAMLGAYWEQIAAFAEVLLDAKEHRLSQRELNAWRDENFQRCNVELSER